MRAQVRLCALRWAARAALLASALASQHQSSGTAWMRGDKHASYSHQATRLRAHLLDGYDKAVPPNATRFPRFTQAGTDVYVQIRLMKVEAVETTHGRMRLKVWWRSSWSDPRLAWEPSECTPRARRWFESTYRTRGL